MIELAVRILIHGKNGVRKFYDLHGSGDNPFEQVEFGDKGIGEDEVVVDELAIGTAGTIGDTPAEGFLGAGKDLIGTMAVLQTDLVSMDMIPKAAGLDDGEETPADLGFFLLGELDGDEAGREGTIKQRPKAFANAGGIDNDVLRVPGFGEAFDFAEDGKMVFANPTVTGNDMIGRMTEVVEGGEVDLDNGKGSGVAAGIGQGREVI